MDYSLPGSSVHGILQARILEWVDPEYWFLLSSQPRDWTHVCYNHLCWRVFFFSLPLASSGRRRQWHPNPGLLPGKSHGWRSLVGCGPWGHEEWDMTKRLHFHFSLLCIGEGNGNPLQCSCLENPRDGVAQSRTQLEWLSSSSSITWKAQYESSFIAAKKQSLSPVTPQDKEPES